MKFTPRPEQERNIQEAAEFLLNSPPGAKRLYAAPTGVGKSVMELGVQERCGPGTWIVSPREEILAGMLDKREAPPGSDPLVYCMSTPVKLRNRVMSGAVDYPRRLVFDETHHHSASVWQQIDMLTGLAPAVGYTATPYRGSPKATKMFRERWGKPHWILTYKQAAELGYIRMPVMSMLPLVDDDLVEVVGGEFEVTSLEAHTVDRLADLADHCKRFCPDGCWDRPTVFSVPSAALAARLMSEFSHRDMPLALVNAATPYEVRLKVFEAVEASLVALVHINIVSEGVDLKLRRYVDLDPTMSPVEWVQKLGRITRPGTDDPPEYVCTNRNILRHSYVLEGAVPMSAVLESEKAFPPTDRTHKRVIGMEAIGRFKPTKTLLANGSSIYVYSMSALVGTMVVQYCCLVHPTIEPMWASRINGVKADGSRDYGRWSKCDPPDGVSGFGSLPPKAITEPMRKWWDRSAASCGLDVEQEVDRKSFQALPVLCDLGLRFT